MQNTSYKEIAFPLHQDSKKAQIFWKIMNYDLSKVEASVKKFQPEIDVDKAMPEYRCFLYLASVTKGKLPVPSKPIDGIWHAAILYTKDYADFCQEVAGRFIHHAPLDNPLTLQQVEQRRKRLTDVCTENFGYMLFDYEADAGCGCVTCDGGTE